MVGHGQPTPRWAQEIEVFGHEGAYNRGRQPVESLVAVMRVAFHNGPTQ